MDPIERRRGDGEATNVFVKRECFKRMQTEGRLPGRRGVAGHVVLVLMTSLRHGDGGGASYGG
jgi:hypothetical protein